MVTTKLKTKPVKRRKVSKLSYGSRKVDSDEINDKYNDVKNDIENNNIGITKLIKYLKNKKIKLDLTVVLTTLDNITIEIRGITDKLDYISRFIGILNTYNSDNKATYDRLEIGISALRIDIVNLNLIRNNTLPIDTYNFKVVDPKIVFPTLDNILNHNKAILAILSVKLVSSFGGSKYDRNENLNLKTLSDTISNLYEKYSGYTTIQSEYVKSDINNIINKFNNNVYVKTYISSLKDVIPNISRNLNVSSQDIQSELNEILSNIEYQLNIESSRSKNNRFGNTSDIMAKEKLVKEKEYIVYLQNRMSEIIWEYNSNPNEQTLKKTIVALNSICTSAKTISNSTLLLRFDLCTEVRKSIKDVTETLKTAQRNLKTSKFGYVSDFNYVKAMVAYFNELDIIINDKKNVITSNYAFEMLNKLQVDMQTFHSEYNVTKSLNDNTTIIDEMILTLTNNIHDQVNYILSSCYSDGYKCDISQIKSMIQDLVNKTLLTLTGKRSTSNSIATRMIKSIFGI
jgi:hypothetical protein